MLFKKTVLFIGLVCAAVTAAAAPIAYDINFTSGFGNPIDGSFNYDSATRRFSSFVIAFDEDVVDLTASANSPHMAGACSTRTPQTTSTDIEDYFNYLSGHSPVGCGNQAWVAFFVSGSVAPPLYRFRLGNFDAFAAADVVAGQGEFDNLIDSGRFTITAASVPHSVPAPSSLALLLVGAALITQQKRKRAPDCAVSRGPGSGS